MPMIGGCPAFKRKSSLLQPTPSRHAKVSDSAETFRFYPTLDRDDSAGDSATIHPPMLLTLRTTHVPATDLGYLLHKHPDRVQTFELAFGKAHVFYPEAGGRRDCTAALLLDVDPVGLVRGGGSDHRPVRQRPPLCGLVVPGGGDRAGVRHRARRPVRGAAGAGGDRHPAGGAARRAALPRRRRASCGACSSRSATRSRPIRTRSTRWFRSGARAATSR